LTYGWNATLFNYPWYGFLVKQSNLRAASKTAFLVDTVGANWVSLPGGASWDQQATVNGKIKYVCRPSE